MEQDARTGKLPAHVPLVAATRGDGVESVYYGSVAVTTAAGERVGGVGDAEFPVFTRSTLKPLQALPFVAEDGPAQFGFSQEQVALMCASHSGEPRHVSAVADMLARIGCTEAQLQCGCHVPLYFGATGTSPTAGFKAGQLHHNCSGKHAGFLAWCRLHGQAVVNYLDPDHPLQQAIRRCLAQFLDIPRNGMPMGVDGCGAPNYALPLSQLAQIYAKLAAHKPSGPFGTATASLFSAMTAHPEMVSGEGRGDLILMSAAPGDWLAKAGADGVQALGIRSLGLGIAIKISDGNPRAQRVAVGSVIEQMDLLPKGMPPSLQQWRDGDIFNYAGRRTGRLTPVFRLVGTARAA